MAIKRSIDYEITDKYDGKKISEFLHNKGYSEKSLTILRHTEGAISIDGKVCHMNERPSKGQILRVDIMETEDSENVPKVKLPFEIVYEDQDIIVVNKPDDMPTHPSKNNYENSLGNALAYYFAEKGETFVFRCLNRLDRHTTGLTIIAKHYVAAGILYTMVKNREVSRIYYAIVEDREGKMPAEGSIDLPLGRKEGSGIERCVDMEKGDRAVTHYQVGDRKPGFALVSCQLETGRTHQIRVHMKAMGHPLIGDFLYNPEDSHMKRQALHAGRISFNHPMTGERLDFEVPMPEDMRRAWEGL